PVLVYPSAPRLDEGAATTYVAPAWLAPAKENRVMKYTASGVLMVVAGTAVLFAGVLDASLPKQFADFGSGSAGDWLRLAILAYVAVGSVVAFSLAWGTRRMTDALGYGCVAAGIYGLVVGIAAGRFGTPSLVYLFALAIVASAALANYMSRWWRRESGWS
ncbi:MAG: hypothetical protein U1E22_09810, partial [Coriobacteriia bacterium]|nr:hypothetical protein [Coriobacteriia bacterium]